MMLRASGMYTNVGKSPLSVPCTGNYQIDLTHNDVILDGSPFIAKAYDPGAIVVGQISSGVVNNPVEFTSKPRHRVTSLHIRRGLTHIDHLMF